MKQHWLCVGYWNLHGVIDGVTKEIKTENEYVHNVIKAHDVFVLVKCSVQRKMFPTLRDMAVSSYVDMFQR